MMMHGLTNPKFVIHFKINIEVNEICVRNLFKGTINNINKELPWWESQALLETISKSTTDSGD
jgi:hypothetical protein